VTEGTSSSAFILDAKGVIRTQPLGRHILPGVTRRSILRLAALEGVALEERPFSVAEALDAREAFMTAASAFVLPIIEIDGVPIGSGRPGPVANRFRALYIEEALNSSVGAPAEA
jgi:D-alanine transaminase